MNSLSESKMMLKLILICTLFSLAERFVYSDDDAELDAYLDKLYIDQVNSCLESTKTDKDLVEKVKAEQKADPALDCFYGCVCKGMGLIKEDGKFDEDDFKKAWTEFPEGEIKNNLQEITNKLKEALSGTSDLCGAGGILQKFMEEFKTLGKT